MDFPKPRYIEAESIAELGLRENVPIPLTLRVAVPDGSWSKKAEVHSVLPD